MKKTLLTATIILLLSGLLPAADGFVQIDNFTVEGFTVTYDWSLDKVLISGKGGTAKLTLNYPFVVTDKMTYRVDAPPHTEEGKLFISAYTAGKIREIVSGEVDALPSPTAIKVVVVHEKKAEPTRTSTPVPEKTVVVKVQPPVPTVTKEIIVVVEDEEKVTPIPAATIVVVEGAKAVEITKKPSGRKLIVLDPGHGGNDPGAIGLNGLYEKDVVLLVAQKVKQKLKPYNADVLITRDTDEFITLKNRAVFANSRDADLFVSIHCNASRNRSAAGTRSYIYNRVASSKEAAEAAKFENKDAGAFEFLMNDLRKSAYEYLSIEAAGNIQHNLISGLRLKWLPTERAPFYVLANTNMPSVLVEIAFISNPKEEDRLKSADFKDKVSISIASGIMQYLDKVK